MRTTLSAAIVLLALFISATPAQAQSRPGPTDAVAAVRAGRQAGAQQVRAQDGTRRVQYVSYRVFATQYQPNTAGSVEVAVPDECVKFASLGWTSALESASCPSGYQLGLNYKVRVRRDSGQAKAIRVKDVGPWNVDDNYWDGKSGPRPRRRFRRLPRGTPEADAAFYQGFHTVPDCKNLDGSPSGHSGPADQFGRCVLNPAGIDLSVAAAQALGLGPGQNEWVTVTFLWEPSR